MIDFYVENRANKNGLKTTKFSTKCPNFRSKKIDIKKIRLHTDMRHNSISIHAKFQGNQPISQGEKGNRLTDIQTDLNFMYRSHSISSKQKLMIPKSARGILEIKEIHKQSEQKYLSPYMVL